MILIVSVVGTAIVTAAVVYGICGWQLEVAEDKERRYLAVRDEAARIEAAAAAHEAAARALYTDTAEYRTIKPRPRVRMRVLVGHAVAEAREWALQLGPDRSSDWVEGELEALNRQPPLRTKSGMPARSRKWRQPQPSTPAPTPLVMAQLPHDPTRTYRVEVLHG